MARTANNPSGSPVAGTAGTQFREMLLGMKSGAWQPWGSPGPGRCYSIFAVYQGRLVDVARSCGSDEFTPRANRVLQRCTTWILRISHKRHSVPGGHFDAIAVCYAAHSLPPMEFLRFHLHRRHDITSSTSRLELLMSRVISWISG